jgi:addiction module HigA family antidote
MEEYLRPMRISPKELARALSIPPRRVNDIIHGKTAITLDTSVRLGCYFMQTPVFWLNLQIDYDFKNAQKLHEEISKQILPFCGQEETLTKFYKRQISDGRILTVKVSYTSKYPPSGAKLREDMAAMTIANSLMRRARLFGNRANRRQDVCTNIDSVNLNSRMA